MRDRRPECEPIPVPHRGGNNLHNKCADKIPNNGFPGSDVLINGKHFDALQLRLPASALWEVKTNAIETYSAFIQLIEIKDQVKEGRRERALASACGYDFIMGVRTQAHKRLLELEDSSLNVVVMDWCKEDEHEE